MWNFLSSLVNGNLDSEPPAEDPALTEQKTPGTLQASQDKTLQSSAIDPSQIVMAMYGGGGGGEGAAAGGAEASVGAGASGAAEMSAAGDIGGVASAYSPPAAASGQIGMEGAGGMPQAVNTAAPVDVFGGEPIGEKVAATVEKAPPTVADYIKNAAKNYGQNKMKQNIGKKMGKAAMFANLPGENNQTETGDKVKDFYGWLMGEEKKKYGSAK
jgi:hypothetical protein